ncbi:la-related protein 6-like [Littorina saxatilis]|uniref:La-related protein 6 n=1 Tax=Littorina saxatilis TaxID=31220 RepID=A0AAN9C4K2_9CAEN
MSGEGGVLVVIDKPDSPVVEGSDRHVGNHAIKDRDEEGPLHGSEAPIVLVAPSLRVEQLRDEDGSSSVYTSEEEGGSHVSDDGDHERSAGGDFPIPDDELRDKIIKQVEFYFSDANILKDSFLLKHVRRNKMGYVSIKLITSFKKVKTLTKDYRVVAFSLRQSVELEVNEEGTKVRRNKPLPEYDETTPSRTVVVVNLPQDSPTIESVAEVFSKCGEVALIRILRPGKSVPPDVKKYATKHPEIGTTTCAVIEFEKHEHAKVACDSMTNTEDWRNGMRVVLLAVPKKKKEKAKEEDRDNDGSPEEGGGDEDRKKKKRVTRKKKTRVDELSAENESSCCSSGSEGDFPNVPKATLKSPVVDPNHLSPHTSPRSSPKSSPRTQRRRNHGKSPLTDSTSPNDPHRPSPRSSPEVSRRKLEPCQGESTPSSPWVQRRLRAAQDSKASVSPLSSPLMGRRNLDGTVIPGFRPRMMDMAGVVRQPRGPDGSIGFYGGFGRGKPRSNTVA